VCSHFVGADPKADKLSWFRGFAEIPGGYLVKFRVRDGWDEAIPRAAGLGQPSTVVRVAALGAR